MRKTLTLLIGLFLITPFLLSQETSKPIAYISDVEGDVLFQGFEQAELNIPVFQGDDLNAKKGRAEIYLGNGNFLRLDRNTRVVFAVLEQESVLLHVWKGNIYLRINTGTIEIQTDHKYFSLSNGSHLIRVGKKTKIYSGIIMIQDDFDRFNDRRERIIDLSSQKRYLPEELADYEYTLHNHGRWYYDALYGNIWVPYVGSSWRPYFHGRWAYYPYYGWTWISYELFGWTTFHYGRWHWHSAWSCWYWIPTRTWGPAWVYWYSGYDYIGWYPRWHDQYHGSRHYISRHDRGLTVIRKDQLQSKNISKSVISKEQLRKKLPQNIEVKRLKKNLEIGTEKQVSKRLLKSKQVQSIKSRGTIKKEPISSRTTSRKKVSKTTDSRARSSSKRATVSKKSSSSKKKATRKATVKKKSSSSSKKATSSKKSSSSRSKSSGKVKKKK